MRQEHTSLKLNNYLIDVSQKLESVFFSQIKCFITVLIEVAGKPEALSLITVIDYLHWVLIPSKYEIGAVV